MSLIPQRTHLRSSATEPLSETLPFLLREDDACRQMLADSEREPAASTSAQRRRAQEICFSLAASAQMEEEPYYTALRTGRGTSP